MKPIFNWEKCPTCNNLFQSGKSSNVLLYVELENETEDVIATGTYRYCSETCMNVKIETLGLNTPIHEMIKVTKKDQISISPNRWRVVCKQIELKIEVANV